MNTTPPAKQSMDEQLLQQTMLSIRSVAEIQSRTIEILEQQSHALWCIAELIESYVQQSVAVSPGLHFSIQGHKERRRGFLPGADND